MPVDALPPPNMEEVMNYTRFRAEMAILSWLRVRSARATTHKRLCDRMRDRATALTPSSKPEEGVVRAPRHG